MKLPRQIHSHFHILIQQSHIRDVKTHPINYLATNFEAFKLSQETVSLLKCSKCIEFKENHIIYPERLIAII